jgi:hypothetical protein
VTRLPDDDDLLVEKLRLRAHDPARRFDKAPVPAAWVKDRYGAQAVENARRSSYTFSATGLIFFPAGSPEPVEYYRSTPRMPLFPPATGEQVDDAERRLGYALPAILRRVYTQVANGGFGPDNYGLASVSDGYRTPDGWPWRSCTEIRQQYQDSGVPSFWHQLTPGGCTMYWYTSLTEPGNPVLLWDADGWEPDDGQSPEDGIRHTTTSLRQWLWTWAEGGNVWGEALAALKGDS